MRSFATDTLLINLPSVELLHLFKHPLGNLRASDYDSDFVDVYALKIHASRLDHHRLDAAEEVVRGWTSVFQRPGAERASQIVRLRQYVDHRPHADIVGCEDHHGRLGAVLPAEVGSGHVSYCRRNHRCHHCNRSPYHSRFQ
jgi:hypothetical protein